MDPQRIAANLDRVRRLVAQAALRSGRTPDAVRLVAVTKTVGADEVRALHLLGVRDFGENRVAEAAAKLQACRWPDVRWHMIGHLQRNKVKAVAGEYRLIHSLDSVRLAEEIQRRCDMAGITQDALVQVNISGEQTKFGLDAGAAERLLQEIAPLDRLRVRGFMTMAPVASDPEEARPIFRGLRELRDRLAGRFPGLDLRELSMGMSQDFEVAVEEGATLVRVGSALFQ